MSPIPILWALQTILQSHRVEEWGGAYRPDPAALDREGFFIAMQFKEDYLYASGVSALPEGYAQMHGELVAHFDRLRSLYG